MTDAKRDIFGFLIDWDPESIPHTTCPFCKGTGLDLEGEFSQCYGKGLIPRAKLEIVWKVKKELNSSRDSRASDS